MLAKDRIFWIAASIFVLSIVLALVTKDQLWCYMMIASYLLRPTLASLGVSRHDLDERQMTIHYRSGNIAFAVMILASVIMAVMLSMKGDHNWEMFTIVITLGVASKALFNVLLVKNCREAAIKMIMAVGMLMVLFASLENGFSLGALIESGPGLAIIAIGWIAKKYPRPVGVLVFVAAALLLFVILAKGFTIGQMATALLVGVPLLLAGASLYLPVSGVDGETSVKISPAVESKQF